MSVLLQAQAKLLADLSAAHLVLENVVLAVIATDSAARTPPGVASPGAPAPSALRPATAARQSR